MAKKMDIPKDLIERMRKSDYPELRRAAQLIEQYLERYEK